MNIGSRGAPAPCRASGFRLTSPRARRPAAALTRLAFGRTGATGAVHLAGVASFILTVAILARVLPPETLGRLVLLITAANLAAVAAQMGLGGFALSLFAGHAARDEDASMSAAAGRMRVLVLASGSLAGGLVALGGVLLWPEDRLLSAAAGVWTFCAAQLLINAALMRASGAVRRAALIAGAGQTLSPACAVAGLIAASLSWIGLVPASPSSLFIAYSLAAAVLLLGLGLARRSGGSGQRRTASTEPDGWGLLAGARPYWLATAAPLLYTQGDIFIVALVAPSEMVGYYAAASRLARAATLPTTILAQSMAPGVAAAYARNAARELRAITSAAVALSAAASLLITLPLILVPAMVLGAVFGAPYAAAAPALAVLAFGRLVWGACGPTGAFLMAGGAGGTLAKSAVWTTGVAITTSLALGALFGAAGVAAGFAAALIGQNLFQLACITARFGFIPHLALLRRAIPKSPRP